MNLDKIKKILDKIKIKSLNELEVKIFTKNMKSYARARWSLFKGYYIILNLTKIKNLNESELTGLLAHEYSHLLQFSEMNYFDRCIEAIKLCLVRFKFPLNMRKIENIERDADIRAIKMGYGKQIISIKKVNPRYLTIYEVEEIMSKNSHF